LILIVISISAYLLSYISVLAIQRSLVRYHLLDIPNERSSHVIPTPRGGGLAIVIVTVICVGVLWFLEPHWRINNIALLLTGAILIAGISYWDDLHSLPYWVRFAVHLAVAGMVVIEVGYWRIVQLPFIGVLELGWVGLPVTFLWIVGMINAYNFMDGIDGMAGGQGVVAGLGWAVLGWLSGQLLIAGIGLVLAASCLGFLGHNWSPARIFMGDVGSAFLGYSFAVFPLVAVRQDTQLAFAGVLLVWPFVFDSSITFCRRLLHNENVFTPHCSHFYQRLVAMGYSHKKVSSLYIGLSIIGLVCSAALVLDWRWADLLTIMTLVITSLILLLGTNWRKRSVSKSTTLT
jgi:UDP-N-acetylmuramyl pentapeptide phosphotransferase/UDP-N-acetylglucosamine-1-phosphate transferase